MKRVVIGVVWVLGLILLTGPAGYAGDMGSMPGMHQDHDMGKMIHMSDVDGYKLSYHLIDLKEKMKTLKMPEGSDAAPMESHHLMVFIADGDGSKMSEGDVGFQVEGPEGTVQKAMAMGMSDGFGANINLEPGVSYVIKTKAVSGNAKLSDQFTFKLE